MVRIIASNVHRAQSLPLRSFVTAYLPGAGEYSVTEHGFALTIIHHGLSMYWSLSVPAYGSRASLLRVQRYLQRLLCS